MKDCVGKSIMKDWLFPHIQNYGKIKKETLDVTEERMG